VGVEVETRAPLLPGPLPTQVYFDRAWITAAAAASADVSCAKRFLNQSIDSVEDLKAMTTMPLSPIGLQQFLVHKSRTDRGLPSISAQLPLDLSNHKAMNTHVAQSMMNRLRTDTKFYADSENVKLEPFLSSMQEQQIKDMVDNPSAGGGVDAAIAQIKSILTALHTLQNKDKEHIQQTMMRTLVLANKVEIVLPSGNSSSLSAGVQDVDAENRARSGAGILMSRVSGSEATITFELLVASLLNASSQLALQKLNPYLKAEDVAQIMDMTVRKQTETQSSSSGQCALDWPTFVIELVLIS
jgi:hypothetical protein